MEWIEYSTYQPQPLQTLRKIEKMTLYDHNCIWEHNPEELTFSSLLNCKRLNRVYSTLCSVQGDLRQQLIEFNCRLLDQQHQVHAQWAYQRIELTRFAFRYNERSYRGILIRTNPLSGQVAVTLSLHAHPDLLQQEHRFRSAMTDLCHRVGQESQMIFNTMLEIILGREASQPYLKSAIKVNPGFPRYMKLQKLLDKIKSLVVTSSFYKIRSDISSAHKNRSYFKKIFLNQDKKLITSPKIVQLALAYQPKFGHRHEENERRPKDRTSQFIKDYIELEEKNEIEFAKHLNEGEFEASQPLLDTSPARLIRQDAQTGVLVLQVGGRQVEVVGRDMPGWEWEHEMAILKQLDSQHSCLNSYYCPGQKGNTLYWEREEELSMADYLHRSRLTLSLSTKLQLMAQICSFLQFCHKKHVGCCLEMDNLFVTRGLEVRIRGFRRCWMVSAWVDTSKESSKEAQLNNLLQGGDFFEYFPYRLIKKNDLENQKCDVHSLGVCLYRILMDKFPFWEGEPVRVADETEWGRRWLVDTEYFLTKGGEIVKLIAYLLLKCMDISNIASRPYVQWVLVILCEIRTSLNGLY